jgi:hypothetical protein
MSIVVGVGILVIAALLIAGWAWMRAASMADLHAMRTQAARSKKATDEWEEPRIVATYGGIYDQEDEP